MLYRTTLYIPYYVHILHYSENVIWIVNSEIAVFDECCTVHLYVWMFIQGMRFKHSTRIWTVVSTLTRCINSVLISCTPSSSPSPSSWQTSWSRGDLQVRTLQKQSSLCLWTDWTLRWSKINPNRAIETMRSITQMFTK